MADFKEVSSVLRRYSLSFLFCKCAVVIIVVSSSTCVTILLQVCSNVLLSVIPWWGCSQSLLGSVWMGLIHSLAAAPCTEFFRQFAQQTCLSSCWHFRFCCPTHLCQLGRSLYYCNGPQIYTSCWCEPGLPLPFLFQSKIETKMRDGFRALAKSSLFCTLCHQRHRLQVSAQQSNTNRHRNRHTKQTRRGVIWRGSVESRHNVQVLPFLPSIFFPVSNYTLFSCSFFLLFSPCFTPMLLLLVT